MSSMGWEGVREEVGRMQQPQRETGAARAPGSQPGVGGGGGGGGEAKVVIVIFK